MVICPNCNKENIDEEYCVVCGTRLIEVEKEAPIFPTSIEIQAVTKNKEVINYFNDLNEKIKTQENLLKSLKEDPIMENYDNIAQIENENKNLKAQIENNTIEINDLKVDLKVLKEGKEKDLKEINDLKNSKKELETENASLSNNINALNSEIENSKIKINSLENDKSSLRLQNSNLLNENNNLKSQNNELEKQISKLKTNNGQSGGFMDTIGGIFKSATNDIRNATTTTTYKICPNCGGSVHSSDNFCTHCGHKFKE